MSARNKVLSRCISNVYQWMSGQAETADNKNAANIIFKPVMLRELEEITEILPGTLYLSGSLPLTAEKIKELGITAIVCALTEMEEERVLTKSYFSLELRMIYVRLADSEGSDISAYFDPITEFVEDEIRVKKGKVLVHCVAGMSRSASLVMAYLMRYKRLTYAQAYGYVANRRKIVHPNDGFVDQLIKFERSLKAPANNNVILTAAVPEEFRIEADS